MFADGDLVLLRAVVTREIDGRIAARIIGGGGDVVVFSRAAKLVSHALSCADCGKKFNHGLGTGRSSKSRYCCAACRVRAFRKRQRRAAS